MVGFGRFGLQLLGLLFCLALAAAGCGKTCSFDTCRGCCDPSGLCLAGTGVDACGSDAGVCLACAATQTCSAGACVDAPGAGGGAAVGGGTATDGGADRAWRVVTLAHAPAARQQHTLVYDSGRHRIILFGGYASPNLLNDTWEYDGVDWTRRDPPVKPPPRRLATMVYDPVHQLVVLFGGEANSVLALDTFFPRDDMWTFDGNTWTEVKPSPRPSPRTWAGTAWDTARSRLVLYGGQHDTVSPDGGASVGTLLADTWEWDGAGWTMMDAGTPPPRLVYSLAYDEARQRTVLSSGFGLKGPQDGTWEYDGASWVLKDQPVFDDGGITPNGKWAESLVFDGVSQRVVQLGGTRGSSRLAGTSSWVPPSWLPGPSLPAPRGYGGAAYDVQRSVVVSFGGYGISDVGAATWEY
jgi:hypothetical protein